MAYHGLEYTATEYNHPKNTDKIYKNLTNCPPHPLSSPQPSP